MCGRYTLHTEKEALAERFHFDPSALAALPARYNIAPTDAVLMLRRAGEGWEPKLARWGLVPPFSKDVGSLNLMINARIETIARKTPFRESLRAQRCLVPADGFYEWSGTKNRRIPHLISRADGQPFAMAGLFAEWRRKDDLFGETVLSFAIITTAANAAVAKLHDRMPVILPREIESRWLDPALDGDTQSLLALLQPVPAESLQVFPVSRRVNSVKNDDPSLLARDDSEPSLGFF